MCCQISDVAITSSSFRRLVMPLSVVSFFFNVIIIAITVNVVAGVLKYYVGVGGRCEFAAGRDGDVVVRGQ